MNLYENQVFALSGHNGAGKTTAMNLMTWMLDMDAGDCYFHSNSVRHDLGLVRHRSNLASAEAKMITSLPRK
jgi:ABC-type multidrug transport system ATPase subunit